MGRKSRSVDKINSFIIANFKEHAWANLWELTTPNKDGMFYFTMLVRPNDYERDFVVCHQNELGIAVRHRIPCSNSLDIPDSEYFYSYGIRIPMFIGSAVTKKGLPVDYDPKAKHSYVKRLSENAYQSLLSLEDDNIMITINSPSEVFGFNGDNKGGWSKFEAYSCNQPEYKWKLTQRRTNDFPESIPFR